MTYIQQARQNKAIGIEMRLRADGIMTVDDLDALSTQERHDYARSAGYTGASADTWNLIRGWFADYDAGRI